MSRLDESYELVDEILGGQEFKKIREAEEEVDNILGAEDGSGPPEHGKGKGPGKGKKECNEELSAYQKFFKSKLEKYGVKSPNNLDKEQKKAFFNDVDKGWKGKKE